MSADATFANRAAARLNKLLDEQGTPFDALGRATAISELLNLSFQGAQQLLSGTVPWSWTQLQSVCDRFERNPGYFLDPEYGGALPSDTQVVPSADGGESIVWRAPRGFLRRPTPQNASLRYLTEHRGAAEFPQGSLLVYAEHLLPAAKIVPGAPYVIARHGALQVMHCTNSRDSLATFEDIREPGVAVVVPFSAPPEDVDIARIAGSVIASISPTG